MTPLSVFHSFERRLDAAEGYQMVTMNTGLSLEAAEYKAKAGTLHARREAGKHVQKREAADKLFKEVGPKNAKRPGGYTRILKTRHRKGDGADMARIELVEN